MKDIVGTAIVAVSMLGLGHCGGTPTPGPSPSPTVAPTPTPTPGPTPEPCVIPADDEPGAPPRWTALETAPQLAEIVRGARPEIACPADPDVLLDALAASLRDLGACAGVPVTPSGQRADAVFVQLDVDVWESYHAVSYATRCWALGPLDTPARATVWRYR